MSGECQRKIDAIWDLLAEIEDNFEDVTLRGGTDFDEGSSYVIGEIEKILRVSERTINA